MLIKDKLSYRKKTLPVTLQKTDTVQKALDLMCEKNIGSIVIIDKDKKVLGIITERDMMRRVLYKNKEPKKTTVSEVMTTNLHSASEDDQLVDWLRMMSNERFRHLPVVDKEGKLVNVLSQGDFVAYTWPDLIEKAKDDLKKKIQRPYQMMLLILSILLIGYMYFK